MSDIDRLVNAMKFLHAAHEIEQKLKEPTPMEPIRWTDNKGGELVNGARLDALRQAIARLDANTLDGGDAMGPEEFAVIAAARALVKP